MNVMSGGRYKVLLKEVKDYVLGKYGKAPGPVAEVLKKLVLRKELEPLSLSPS